MKSIICYFVLFSFFQFSYKADDYQETIKPVLKADFKMLVTVFSEPKLRP